MLARTTATVSTRTCARIAFKIGVLVGLIVALAMMKIAWSHNAQGEVHSEGQADWGYLGIIGATWFGATTLAVGSFGFLVMKVARSGPTTTSPPAGSADTAVTEVPPRPD